MRARERASPDRRGYTHIVRNSMELERVLGEGNIVTLVLD